MKAALTLCVLLLVACAGPEKKTKESTASSASEASAEANEKKPPVASTVTCQNAHEKRVLTLQTAEKGCEVVYERNGEKMVAASAKNDPTHCAKVIDRIRGNLEKAGFKCGR